MNQLDENKRRKINQKIIDAAGSRFVPPRASFSSEDAKALFYPPITLNTKEPEKAESRFTNDAAIGSSFNAYYASLTQHALDLGQFPMTSFVGYGVLQNIAQNGMIRTCIQTVADDMCREWIQVEGGEDESADNVKKLQDLQENKYRLRKLFNEALSIVGFMGGCFIFVDTGVEGEALKLPLNYSDKSAELVGEDKSVKFVVIDPVNVSPGFYNANQPLKDDYLKPKSWFVFGQEVHASRLIRLIDNEPPLLLRPAYNFLGIPQAQILWDYVLHWNKARETGVSILEKLNLTVFKTNFAEAFEAGGIEQLDAKMMLLQRYRSNEAIFACDSSEDLQNITLTISGVEGIIRQALEFIAAINRTPAVKLLGISPSGFNATGQSDIRNYYDHIKSKQELNRDAIQTVLKAIQLVEFGHVDPSVTFKFNELGEADAAATAITAKTKVDMLAVLQDRNVLSAEEVREFVRRDSDMGLDFIPEELPEGMEGELMTDDPSQQNELMNNFLKQRSAENVAPAPKTDEDKTGEIF